METITLNLKKHGQDYEDSNGQLVICSEFVSRYVPELYENIFLVLSKEKQEGFWAVRIKKDSDNYYDFLDTKHNKWRPLYSELEVCFAQLEITDIVWFKIDLG